MIAHFLSNNDVLQTGLTRETGRAAAGHLNKGVSQVPPSKAASELTSFQHCLPVYQMRDAITKAINDNRVLMVAGETGSGKTTQVTKQRLHSYARDNDRYVIYC